MKNGLLSYPRSGNHLTRFMIELLTETPTYGCQTNALDIPIYQNHFKCEIPFNITNTNTSTKTNTNTKNNYYKYHGPIDDKISNLIFIIRNPREVLLRHNDYKINERSFNTYFDCIDFYLNFKGRKVMFFYEDIVTNRVEFINQLYDFLDIKITNKLEYVLNNIDFLYEQSKSGEKRKWGGVNSNSVNFYYNNPQMTPENKEIFDNYLKIKMKNSNYKFLIEKYNL